MSHVNVKMPSVSASSRKSIKLDSFGGGVAFCDFATQLYKGQSPYMKNLIFNKNLLRTRFGQKEVTTDCKCSGKLHSKSDKLFFGKYILHIGTRLIAFDGKTANLISDTLSDCDSFMFEMNANQYIFLKNARIFIVNKDFSCREHVFPATELYYNASADLSEFQESIHTTTSDNLLHGKISVSYSDVGFPTDTVKLPTKCDTFCPIDVYGYDGKRITSESYTVEGDRLYFNSAVSGRLYIEYLPAPGESYRESDKIFGCTTAVCYGGKSSSGGTRVFFSGNKDYPGYYFHSELLSPLEIKKECFNIIGNGSQNINRLAKQKGELVAFCNSSVHKISYSFDSDSGPDFSVSEINPAIGCDMPESVQLIDNRLVFANSSGGIFIILSSDFTNELSVRSICANIGGTNGKVGFFSEDRAGLKNSISIDFDRKYFLFANSHAYVWDYGNTPYVTSYDPAQSEKLLSWYYFDGLYETSLFEIGGELYGTCPKDDGEIFVHLSEKESTDFGKAIICEYRTEDFDLSFGDAKKVLYEASLNVLKNGGASITLTAFGDGKEIRSERFTVPENKDANTEGLYRHLFCIPPYEAFRFSLRLTSDSGILGIYDAVLKFKADKIYYRQ